MKKIINSPETALKDSLEGFVSAHGDLLKFDKNGCFITRKNKKENGKVALISGGGSGHEPLHAGFIGLGMLDAACAGQIFTSPTPDQMIAACEKVDTGGGVLFIVKNYAGDVMNFEMAAELYTGTTGMVIVDDDVALLGGNSRNEQGNRGMAGTVIVEKIIGAAAERGLSIEACMSIGSAVNEATGSMAAALTSCTVPAVGVSTFSLADDEIELGVGIHGEAGRERTKIKSSDELAEIFIDSILEKIQPNKDDPLILISNGLGATPPMELYTLYNSAEKTLKKRGFTVARSLVGNYCTALDMAGASLTLTKLTKAH